MKRPAKDLRAWNLAIFGDETHYVGRFDDNGNYIRNPHYKPTPRIEFRYTRVITEGMLAGCKVECSQTVTPLPSIFYLSAN